jgi:MoaA/NifB/PqqE/SkfB family radical SAM enzyme
MVGPAEIARRIRTRRSGRIESLPVLALAVHGACNCRCVMCDIWKANAEKREIAAADLERHAAAIRALHVQRVMLTGGEPLLHRNLWALCRQLQAMGIRITLVTTGLLIEPNAADIAGAVDTVVVSLDGDRATHNAIRRVTDGFERLARGVMALRGQVSPPRLIARSVLQRMNCHSLAQTIQAAHAIGVDEISFLGADVSSQAFNRGTPWTAQRAADVSIGAADIWKLKASIEFAVSTAPGLFSNGFVVGGRLSLDRISDYYAALAGLGPLPAVRCNAPWVSAVLEADGRIRPCFFHPPYESGESGLAGVLNSDAAIAFRNALDIPSNGTCRRCVCSLNLSTTQAV